MGYCNCKNSVLYTGLFMPKPINYIVRENSPSALCNHITNLIVNQQKTASATDNNSNLKQK